MTSVEKYWSPKEAQTRQIGGEGYAIPLIYRHI
jgi:hypothetical protein